MTRNDHNGRASCLISAQYGRTRKTTDAALCGPAIDKAIAANQTREQTRVFFTSTITTRPETGEEGLMVVVDRWPRDVSRYK